MDKQRARQLYELADRLSKLDVNTLSEEQLSHRNTMIAKLQEEVREGITDTANDPGEYDQEGDMAKQDLATAANAAEELRSILDSDENLPEWVQSKITKAVDYLDTVRDYMKSKDQDVSEASQRVDSLVTDALKIMRGSDYQVDAVKAIKTVLGDREYNSRRGFYSFYVKQLMDMHSQEGIAEAGFPGAPDVEMPPMKPSGDPQRDKLKQEYMDLHREIKSLVDIPYRSDSSPEQKMQAKARIKQLNDRADQIKAILEPRQPPNEWQKKTYGYDDNWNRVGKGIAETKKLSPKLTPVNIKKSETVSEEINTEAYERLQKVFAFKNYES
jgi:hypothetical protein